MAALYWTVRSGWCQERSQWPSFFLKIFGEHANVGTTYGHSYIITTRAYKRKFVRLATRGVGRTAVLPKQSHPQVVVRPLDEETGQPRKQHGGGAKAIAAAACSAVLVQLILQRRCTSGPRPHKFTGRSRWELIICEHDL
jgi:hypothetical protein